MNVSLSFKLQTFEGPLDLLLHLIEKNKVNIYDIPVAEITNQYLEYVEAMEVEDLDLVSEFLVMAATLIDIKSRLLLPKQVNEEGEEEGEDDDGGDEDADDGAKGRDDDPNLDANADDSPLPRFPAANGEEKANDEEEYDGRMRGLYTSKKGSFPFSVTPCI